MRSRFWILLAVLLTLVVWGNAIMSAALFPMSKIPAVTPDLRNYDPRYDPPWYAGLQREILTALAD